MKFAVLASSSKGNSIVVGENNNYILIDAGLSGKRITERLRKLQIEPYNIKAIFISHEHGDHILGVGVLARKYGIPVYITRKTYQKIVTKENLSKKKIFGTIPNLHLIDNNTTIYFCGFNITTFPVVHDAVDPVGFVISNKNCSIGISTDLGNITNLVKHHFSKVNYIIIESNYDDKMILTNGTRSWADKQRVMGRYGHLSNLTTYRFLNEIRHDKLQGVTLVHVSEDHNSLGRLKENFDNFCIPVNYFINESDIFWKEIAI